MWQAEKLIWINDSCEAISRGFRKCQRNGQRCTFIIVKRSTITTQSIASISRGNPKWHLTCVLLCKVIGSSVAFLTPPPRESSCAEGRAKGKSQKLIPEQIQEGKVPWNVIPKQSLRQDLRDRWKQLIRPDLVPSFSGRFVEARKAVSHLARSSPEAKDGTVDTLREPLSLLASLFLSCPPSPQGIFELSK
jgi:hypothetical protein